MEHNQHDFHQFTSPREQVELMQELESLEGGEAQLNLQFEDGENPFSYYRQENHRDMSSSEDQRSSQSSKSHQNLPDPPQIQSDLPHAISPPSTEYPKLEVGENLSSRLPINFSHLAVASLKEPEARDIRTNDNNPVSIRLLKQVQVDLASMEINQKAKKSKDEAIYRKELEDDIEDLKDNFKGSNKNKNLVAIKQEKLSPKANLNKTCSPVVNSKVGRDNSLEAQEIRMLIKMGFEKKKANYGMLIDWDRKRAASLALHGRMVQLLQNEVDLRIKSSLQNFEYYQTFFREKAKQQQKYVTSPVINTCYALQNNSISKNVYINCSIILNSLCDENVTRCKNISNFIQLIRINILKELTENHFNSSQKELLTIREKISSLKTSLKKYNAETEEKANELANLFVQQSANITNKLDKDFYRTQISFLRKAQHQIEVQTKLGEYCLEYYHTAIREQLKRSQVIREAMVTYSQGLKQAYNLQLQCEQMQQMSKHEQIKLIQQFYSLDDMFDERTIELFKQRNSIKAEGDITLEMFTTYINGFNYDYFDSRVILLKQFFVRYVTVVKSKETSEQNCYLVITVDNFLHLFFNNSKTVYSKPDITIKISRKHLQVKVKKDQMIDIIKKQEKRNSMMSYFWDNKVEKIYRIKFGKKDSQEEFMDYITKLMIDNC